MSGGNGPKLRYDCVVIGGGLAGMEAALNLGDMGFEVLLVEKEASIGGKMILLSKVFPTLDCASCISTPKMAATQAHPKITIFPYSRVKGIVPKGKGFEVEVIREPTYVEPSRCTGCGQCEKVCTVARPDQFNEGLVARRAIYIPFPQAVPKKAVIERRGLSPCSQTCPAGVKAHGYVALIRAGRAEQALRRHLKDAPLVGTLSRVCYAPCETRCTKGVKTGSSVPIRALKGFLVEHLPSSLPNPPLQEEGPSSLHKGGSRGGREGEKRVAVIGSGPAGLSCAYFLAQRGVKVTVFEKESEPGGLLRYGIPTWRLPREVLDRDLEEIKKLGVSILTGHPVESPVSLLKNGDFEAVFVAIGCATPRKLGIPGEDLKGVFTALEFLKRFNAGEKLEVSGKRVLVIGGGNVALDCARSALRCGAREVTVVYRRQREHMPAYAFEVEEAEKEGVRFRFQRTPLEFKGQSAVERVVLAQVRLGEKDESGRERPIVDRSQTEEWEAEVVITAIGFEARNPFERDGLKIHQDGRFEVDPETLATNILGLYAGGDCVTGPFMVANAVGMGKRAAYHIYKYLFGKEPEGLELTKNTGLSSKASWPKLKRPESLEIPDLKTAIRTASECLDCAVCSNCLECARVCPAQAINFSMKPQRYQVETKAVLLATGFRLFEPSKKPLYGYADFPNVITAMQMDRLLAPTRPYNAVLRPSDGKIPGNIGIVLCAGSRDQSAGNPWCSRICCMYSIKQAQLIMGAIPIADITIYYIDIRAFGKGYEEFFKQAAAMGVNFVKGKVARIDETANQDLIVYYEDMEGQGGVKKARHDLVVLATGALGNPELRKYVKGLELNELGFVKEKAPIKEPCATEVEGLFVAGAASGPKDIPDTVLHAGAAAAQIAAYLKGLEGHGR